MLDTLAVSMVFQFLIGRLKTTKVRVYSDFHFFMALVDVQNTHRQTEKATGP